MLGLAAVAAVPGTLAAVAGGRTALVSANLLRNGGAEIGPAAVNDLQTVIPDGWQTTAKFTSVIYGAHGGFPPLTASAPIHGGRQFFAGGPGNPLSTATQKVRVPAAFLRGRADVRLSADLGGFSSQRRQRGVGKKRQPGCVPGAQRGHLVGVECQVGRPSLDGADLVP